jgi:hypothetical protein
VLSTVLSGKNVLICGLVLPVMLVRLFKSWSDDCLDLQSRLHLSSDPSDPVLLLSLQKLAFARVLSRASSCLVFVTNPAIRATAREIRQDGARLGVTAFNLDLYSGARIASIIRWITLRSRKDSRHRRRTKELEVVEEVEAEEIAEEMEEVEEGGVGGRSGGGGFN